MPRAPPEGKAEQHHGGGEVNIHLPDRKEREGHRRDKAPGQGSDDDPTDMASRARILTEWTIPAHIFRSAWGCGSSSHSELDSQTWLVACFQLLGWIHQLTPIGALSGSGIGSGGMVVAGFSGEGSTKRPRATQPGSHQFQRPNRLTIAGTSRARTMVASIRMPTPRAVPSTLVSVPGEVAMAEK